jgi:hypothetical protein
MGVRVRLCITACPITEPHTFMPHVDQPPRGAALPLHLESVPGLGLPLSFGLDLGFAIESCGVFAAGLLFGRVCRHSLRRDYPELRSTNRSTRTTANHPRP